MPPFEYGGNAALEQRNVSVSVSRGESPKLLTFSLDQIPSKNYFGVQICPAFTSTVLLLCAKRPDYELWDGWLSLGERVVRWPLPQIKALIKEAPAIGTSQSLGSVVNQSNEVNLLTHR